MAIWTLVRVACSQGVWKGSKRKPFRASVHVLSGPTKLQDKVDMSSNALLGEFVLQFWGLDWGSCVYLASSGLALSTPLPSHAASGHLEGAPSSGDRPWWINPAKAPRQAACFLFYLFRSLVTRYSVLLSSTWISGEIYYLPFWVFAVFISQALLNYVTLLSPWRDVRVSGN